MPEERIFTAVLFTQHGGTRTEVARKTFSTVGGVAAPDLTWNTLDQHGDVAGVATVRIDSDPTLDVVEYVVTDHITLGPRRPN